MSKIILKESEKDEILGKHKTFQKVLLKNLKESKGFSDKLLSEQNVVEPKGDMIIKRAHGYTDEKTGEKIDGLCNGLKGDTFEFVQTNKGLGLRNIPQTKDSRASGTPRWEPNDYIYYYSDFTYEVYSGDDVKKNPPIWTKKGTYKWACPALYGQSQKISKAAGEQLGTEKWLTYKEATTKDETTGLYPINWSDKDSYITKQIGPETYYQPKKVTSNCPSGPVSKEEYEFVKNFTGSTEQTQTTYRWCGTLNAGEREDRNKWVPIIVPFSQTSNRPKGIILYKKVSDIVSGAGTTIENVKKSNKEGTTSRKASVTNQSQQPHQHPPPTATTNQQQRHPHHHRNHRNHRETPTTMQQQEEGENEQQH